MSPLLNAGTAWRGATGLPQRFSLRAYVPHHDLEAVYQNLVLRAVTPEIGADNQLTEQLTRLATQEDGPLPPAREQLWTMPFSTASAARDGLLRHHDDFPVYHPPQRLHRTAQAVRSERKQQTAPLITLLLDQGEVDKRVGAVAAQRRTRTYTQESDWTVPLAWLGLFIAEDRATVDRDGQPAYRLVAPADVVAERARWAAQVLEDSSATLEVVDLELEGNVDPDEQWESDYDGLTKDLRTMARWAQQFSATALICLNYGSIADGFQPDESPRDFQDAIHLLGEHDVIGSEVALQRILKRWIPLSQLQHAS